jgi:hypothetical protein
VLVVEPVSHELAHQYRTAAPFRHVVIDHFIPQPLAMQAALAAEKWGGPPGGWYQYRNPLELKKACDQVQFMPESLARILRHFNSPAFLTYLEQLTGIKGLVPDPYYRGGGLHRIERGGKLDVHVDFNVHPKLKLHRRLNCILYLNRDWVLNWGGDLQLWEGRQVCADCMAGDYQHAPCKYQHELLKLHRCVFPVVNRFVCFDTSEKSYHGHPNPLLCPPDRARLSLATYYYTADPAPGESAAPHSTTFVARPEDAGDGLDALRAERNAGRLATQVTAPALS